MEREPKKYHYRQQHIDLGPDYGLVFQHSCQDKLRTKELILWKFDRTPKEDLVEPAILKWASPVVLASKENGMLGSFFDLRSLKVLTVREKCLLP